MRRAIILAALLGSFSSRVVQFCVAQLCRLDPRSPLPVAAGQGSWVQQSTTQIRLAQIGAVQPRAAQIGAAQGSSHQAREAQVGTTELGAIEAGLAEVGPLHLGLA